MIDYSAAKGMSSRDRLRWMVINEKFGSMGIAPNRPQFDMIKAVGTLPLKDKFIFLVTSANGVGKTTSVWNMLLQIFYQNNNLYRNIVDLDTGEKISGFFDFPIYNNFPREWPKNVWYVSNTDAINFIHEEMKLWAPKNEYQEYTEEKKGKQYISRVNFHRVGWNVWYKTVDQEAKVFETANISIVIFDEIPPEELYDAAIYRTRKGGFVIIIATPLKGSAWFWDRIIDHVEEDGDKWDQTVNIWQNCIERAGSWDLGKYGIQKKGNITEKKIKFIIKNTNPDHVEARIHGRASHLSGIVFKSYDRDIHRKPVEIPEHAPIFMYRMVLDPHDRRPPAVAWFRMDAFGRIQMIREWPSVNDTEYHGQLFIEIKDSGKYTIKDFCRSFIEIEKELKIPANRIQRIIDPNFGKKKQANTGLLVWQDYTMESRKLGRPFHFILNAHDDIASGHAAIKNLLKIDSVGECMFSIGMDCLNTDLAFRRYAWKDWKGKDKDEKALSERIQEKYKDFMDLVRYSAVIPWKYVDLETLHPMVKDSDYDERTIKAKLRRLKHLPLAARPTGVEGV